MSARRFAQVDVFTARAGYGNALAVVLDGDGLDDASMQRLAAWTNLSESAFVLSPTKPGADFRVRIFTPRQELPFAGHPTIGATHAVLEAGRFADVETLNLECAAGVLPVSVERGGNAPRISIRAPQAKFADRDDALIEPLEAALGASLQRMAVPRIVDVGAIWLIVELADARTVRALVPRLAAVADITERTGSVGIAVFGHDDAGDATIAVRAFCPADGIPEDPVTGSANAAIGAYLLASGGLAATGRRYRASQGREVGRDGFVDVDVDPASGAVTIGGTSVTVIEGTLRFGPDA